MNRAVAIVDQIKTGPCLYDSDAADTALADYPPLAPALHALLRNTASCSPYLATLIARHRDWLVPVLDQDPAAALDMLLADTGADAPSLRLIKSRAALLTALCDLGGVWDWAETTAALSRLAERVLQVSVRSLIADELTRGRLPGFGGDDDPDAIGYTVLAMGKLGAGELNYSSDIDLIVLFDESRFSADDYAAARKSFIRVTQALVKMLSEQTADGYVFRTDLRLRPNPSATPVCVAMDAAEHYYESVGRTWERAAMIKARAIAGDLAAGQAFLDRLKPFVWRRNLDFAAIRDAEDMVVKIRDHKGLTGPVTFAGHDMKLGRGGIREIEFFAQTQQLIFGGRDETLRTRRTVDTLAALVDAGRLPGDAAQTLRRAYAHHRDLEHRIQMLDDAQTHSLPRDPEKLARLAAFCGFDAVADMEADVTASLNQVHALTDLRRDEPAAVAIPAEAAALLETHAETWHDLPALRSPRSREIFANLRPTLAARVAATDDPEGMLAQFGAFLAAQPAGVQLWSLFEANIPLVDLFLDICATAPDAARYLSSKAMVLESVLDRAFFADLPDKPAMMTMLSERMGQIDDYESALDVARIWKNEMHFRVGVHLLRGLTGPDETAAAFSAIAETVVAGLLPHVIAQISARFGPPPGNGMAVVAMGKLGSRQMTASSDLDLIVIYDAADATESSGPRTISVSAYYAKATQGLISALTVLTSEGGLFEVDMRLRPSGRKGPVATALSAFRDYQVNEAWTWEHLALTRARAIAGEDKVVTHVSEIIQEIRAVARGADGVLSDVAEMRARLAAEKATGNIWRVKSGPGRLMEVELLVQTGAIITGLCQGISAPDLIPPLVDAGWFSEDEAEILSRALSLYAAVQQVARYVGQGFDPSTQKGAAALVLAQAGFANLPALETALITAYRNCGAIVAARLVP